jgi:hypothetical protein
MTPRRTGEDALLTSEEITVIRRALATCSNLLAWAGAHAGPDFRTAVTQASGAAGHSRSPGGLYYDVNLAIDYLDYAPAARTTARNTR